VNEKDLDALLAQAAEADRTLEAPYRVETALVRAYRAAHPAADAVSSPAPRRGFGLRQWTWLGVAAAAAALAVVATFKGDVRPPVEAPQVAEAEAEAEFQPLPYADFDDVDAVRVVRVSMSPAALTGMGYSGTYLANDDGVLRAELLVGNDGLARGIRFVQ
jgi:hypothetical protein